MENLGIDSKLLIAQVINFAIFFFIFKKFIAKPFIGFINQEKNKEEQREKALAEVKKQEEAIEVKVKKIEDDNRAKTRKMIDEVKEEATQMKKQMLAEAHEEMKTMKEKTKEDIERMKENEQRAMQDKVRELSFFIVNKALTEALPDESKKKITAQILKNLPNKISLK